jgi:hypothetical protein
MLRRSNRFCGLVFFVLIIKHPGETPRSASFVGGSTALLAGGTENKIRIPLQGPGLFKAAVSTLLHVTLPTSVSSHACGDKRYR